MSLPRRDPHALQREAEVSDLTYLLLLPDAPEPTPPPGRPPRTWRGLLRRLTPVAAATLDVIAGAVLALTAVYVAAHLIRWAVMG